MQIMRMTYDNFDKDGYAILHVYGVGNYRVFSGQNPYTNLANCAFRPNSAIPVGKYWIVDRPVGSRTNQFRAWVGDLITGNDHREWFGLFSAQTMTDSILINGVLRGSFRLHPLRPDGGGLSQGCITFVDRNDFYIVRQTLLRTSKVKVPGSRSGLLAYGYVDVQGSRDYASCEVH